MEKQKEKNSKWLPRVHRVWLSGKRKSSPSALAAALGEEGVFP